MKKLILSIFLAFAAFVLNAQNKIELKNFGEGTYNYSNESSISFGKSKPVNQKQAINYTLRLKQAEGKKTTSFKFNTIKCEKKKKDSITVLDTEKTRLPLSYIIKRATKKELSVDMTNKNLTQEGLSGIDSINAHLFDDFAKLPDSVSQVSYKHFIKEEYGNNLIRSLIENTVSIAPDSVIKEKGSWTKNTVRYGSLISNTATTYIFKEKKDNTILIEGVNIIDKNKPARYSISGIAYQLEDIDGKIVSNIVLDKETGAIKSSTTTITAKGKATPLNYSESTEESISDDIVISIKQTITKE